MTPLMAACRAGHEGVVRVLLARLPGDDERGRAALAAGTTGIVVRANVLLP